MAQVAGAIGAAAGATDLTSGIATSHDRYVDITIELSNATKHILYNEGFFLARGQMKIPPQSIISPDEKDALFAQKRKLLLTGTSGMAVWKIGHTNIRLMVTWNVPFFTANRLAVNFIDGEVNLTMRDYNNTLRRGNNDTCKKYKKESACAQAKATCKDFSVRGIMGSDSKCTAKVDLLPLNKDVASKKFEPFVP